MILTRQLVVPVMLAFTFLVLMLQESQAAVVSDGATEQGRPRVGLVLGGGGARGAAHVGVLKELERLRIPVDAIAGTSMGAIVGGLYATGINADDLEQLVRTIDWTGTLSDKPERQDLSFRRKQDDREFPINFELGVRNGDLLLPKGVIQGQKLDLLLRELTLSSSHIKNFDDLPIPFRAIASDIVAGEAVVLDSGDLAKSLRASMSVPGVFSPARIDGRLLVDGGIVGNLPIDVMKGMGVDIIIAVDVEFPLYKSDELESVLTISEQMLTIMIRKETLRQIETLGDQDILIKPKLGVYASSNFADIAETMEPGQLAVIEQQQDLTKLSMSPDDWNTHLAQRKTIPRENEKLAFVRVVHDGKLASRVFESRLSVKAGDPIDATLLAQNANRLYGLQLYEHVGYQLVDEAGATGVEYRATAKSWGPNFLQFGMSLEDDIEGSTSFNLAARLTKAGLNRLGAEWRTDLQLGTDPTIRSEFYQPLSFDSRWFFAPRMEAGQSNLNVFAGDQAFARYRVSQGDLGFDVGRELGTIGEFRVGVYRGAGSARVKVGDPALSSLKFETGGAFARLRVDSTDSSSFPRSGIFGDVVWNLSRPGLGSDHKFDTVDSDFSRTFSRGKSTVQLGLRYATTLSSDNTVQDFFPMGGFLNLSGLERGEISGPHAALARVIYYRRVGDTTGDLFETPIYLGVSAEAGNVWQTRSAIDFDTMRINGSIFAGVDSYFGPVFLAAGFAEHGEMNVYLFIGALPR